MLQHDFRDGDTDEESYSLEHVPQPAFIHWNGLKYAYFDGVEPFAVARTYVPSKGRRIESYRGVFYDWIGNLNEMGHCIDLPERKDLPRKTWSECFFLNPLFLI
jgi:hypothetical protein